MRAREPKLADDVVDLNEPTFKVEFLDANWEELKILTERGLDHLAAVRLVSDFLAAKVARARGKPTGPCRSAVAVAVTWEDPCDA